MTLSSPARLLAFLEEEGLRPKKSLSQNFLIDQNIIDKIVKTAALDPEERVLEIGPGPGALTEALLRSGARVVAVEKDEKFAERLARFPEVEIFAGDICDFSLDRMKGEKKAKVVANLPYHLTSTICGLLLPRIDLFSSLTLMVQEEVGRRMTAQKGTSDYSSLTIFLQFYSRPTYAFKVSRRCFFPAPKIESAVIHFEMKEKIPDVDPALFFPFVRKGFGQRRKMLRSTLSSFAPKQKIEEALEQIGCRKESRPENLSLEEWLSLFSSCQAI